MYLQNVLINKKLINFNDNWQLFCYHIMGDILTSYAYDFSVPTYSEDNTLIKIIEQRKEIARISLINYKYKILTNKLVSSTEFDIYRIPRTFTIAYNETHLISVSMCANLYMLYWRLECKDIMRVITEYLFNAVKYDYSLYICAN